MSLALQSMIEEGKWFSLKKAGVWYGVVWCGVCGVVWCGVVWCVWSGVVWLGVE